MAHLKSTGWYVVGLGVVAEALGDAPFGAGATQLVVTSTWVFGVASWSSWNRQRLEGIVGRGCKPHESKRLGRMKNQNVNRVCR